MCIPLLHVQDGGTALCLFNGCCGKSLIPLRSWKGEWKVDKTQMFCPSIKYLYFIFWIGWNKQYLEITSYILPYFRRTAISLSELLCYLGTTWILHLLQSSVSIHCSQVTCVQDCDYKLLAASSVPINTHILPQGLENGGARVNVVPTESRALWVGCCESAWFQFCSLIHASHMPQVEWKTWLLIWAWILQLDPSSCL